MLRLAVTGLALVTMACAAVPPPAAEEPVPAAGEGTCDIAKTRGLVGRPVTPELDREALRLSGAARLRTIRPGDMVTMDYREDRLNLELDEAGRVKAVRCG